MRGLVTQHFNALASHYDEKAEQRKKYLDAINNLIIGEVSQRFPNKTERANLTLLDLGCGTGLRTATLAKELHITKTYGLDIAENMVQQAKKKIKYVQQADIQNFNLEKKQFDVILCLFNCFGYLHTYQERVCALENIHLHLKNGGLLFIDVMNLFHTGEGMQFKRGWRSIVKDITTGLAHPSLGFGNKFFCIEINGKKIGGFVHAHFPAEMKALFWKTHFMINKEYIIGYDSGNIKRNSAEGQLFYICQKKI